MKKERREKHSKSGAALDEGRGKRGDTEVMPSTVTPSKARFLRGWREVRGGECLTLPQARFLRPGEVRGRSERHNHLQCRMRDRTGLLLPLNLWLYDKHYPLPTQSHHLRPPSLLLIHLPSGLLGMISLNNYKDEASF